MSSSAMQTERERPITSAAILRAMADGILVVDRAGYIRQINPAAALLLAVDPAAALDRAFSEFPAGSSLGQIEVAPSGTIAVGARVISYEQRPLLADDAPDTIVGTLVVLRDQTDEQSERRQQYDLLCRALHDVRVPLQAISGAAEGLMRGWFGPLTDDQREFAGLIKENANHQGDLFAMLYDAYAFANHFIGIDPEHISVESVIREAEQLHAPRLAVRQQMFTVDLPGALPMIDGDRKRLQQVLSALLGNASRYTYPGGAVALRAHLDGDHVLIEVEDTGVGIRAEDQPKIFTPFFRGDNPLKEGRYGGLNLLIAKLLVELHGGRMWFTSIEGQGSTFSFTLPAA